MNKEEYLKKKQEQKELFDSEQRRSLCTRCVRSLKSCICSLVTSFDTNTKLVVLMHPMEAKKEKVGTGRMTHLFLDNSEIIMGVDFSNDGRVNELCNNEKYFPVVLYPGEEATNLSKGEDFKIPEGRELVIFVIDGTWPCAKKMMRESLNIRSLPRVCFTPKEKSQFLVKAQPIDFCLSTIESVHALFNDLDKLGLEDLGGVQDRLIEGFKKMVQYQIDCASDPSRQSYRNKPFKLHKDRKISKKWTSRNVVVD